MDEKLDAKLNLRVANATKKRIKALALLDGRRSMNNFSNQFFQRYLDIEEKRIVKEQKKHKR